MLSVALGAIGLGAVFCFHYPSLLTMPELRGLYPVPFIRALLHLVLVSSFIAGVISVCLRHRKILGMVGISLTLIAALLGGSRVPLDGELQTGPFLGLDWFLLNLMAYSAVFIPLERLFARLPEQDVFRRGWRTDLAYFFLSALLVQVTTLLTMRPAMTLFAWAISGDVQRAVSASAARRPVRRDPGADRLRAVPGCIAHFIGCRCCGASIGFITRPTSWTGSPGRGCIWLTSRSTRGLTYVPIYVLGFAETALVAYVAFVSIQATFIHANVRFNFGPLRWVMATPQFHHWHHGAEREAVDKNFAVHLPLLDRLFGTCYLPGDRWPASYGLAGGKPVPRATSASSSIRSCRSSLTPISARG